MKITIGELINEVMKYSSSVEMIMKNGIPYVHAYMSNSKNHIMSYLNIAQTDEFIYYAIDDINETCGARFIPNGSTSKPFIRELDRIHELYGGIGFIDDSYTLSVENANYEEFMIFFINLLIDREVIKVTPNIMKLKIEDIGFHNVKIRRIISKVFNESNMRTGTIQDLIYLILVYKKKFNISSLRSKDIQFVYDKLKDYGIICEIKDGIINGITFEKR